MSKKTLILYWSRRDFRVTDNPALSAALCQSGSEGSCFLPIFILEPYMKGDNPMYQFGYSARVLLAQSLPVFAQKFSHFCITHGTVVKTFKKIQKEFDVHIHVNEDVYPDFYSQVEKIKKAGIEITVHADALTISKDTRTGQGDVYSIFTPFKNAVWDSFTLKRKIEKNNPSSVRYVNMQDVQKVVEVVDMKDIEKYITLKHVIRIREGKKSIDIDIDKYADKPSLNTLIYIDEDGAVKHFKNYVKHIDDYKDTRDLLDVKGTSQMSVALAWGFVSARMLLEMIRQHHGDFRGQGIQTYISELIWREFYKYLLYHNPHLIEVEFQKKYRDGVIQWVYGKEGFDRFIAWIQGKTGYPIVDAAMRQIAKTGWMHNRARMVVGSILTKNLGIDWRWGQEYFRSVLFDIDEASNNGGWQWSASVGADPKPIRIFNPELQAERFDVKGVYVKTWLGDTAEGDLFGHIQPMVPHKDARDEALRRYGLKSE